TDELLELAPMDTAEPCVEPDPASHAVDVDGDLAAPQCWELLPREPDRLLDLAEDAQIPRREVDRGNAARVEDGPLLGQVLARRESRRVVALFDDCLFGFGAEHAA